MKLSKENLARSVALGLALFSATITCAQQEDGEVTVVSHIDIIPDAYKPGAEEMAARLLRTLAAASHQDRGLVSYVIFQQDDERNHLTIVETWRDTQSYQLHQGAPHTIQFRNGLQSLLGSPVDSREHHAFR